MLQYIPIYGNIRSMETSTCTHTQTHMHTCTHLPIHARTKDRYAEWNYAVRVSKLIQNRYFCCTMKLRAIQALWQGNVLKNTSIRSELELEQRNGCRNQQYVNMQKTSEGVSAWLVTYSCWLSLASKVINKEII